MASFALADIELVSNTPPELYIAASPIVAGNVIYLDANTLAVPADADAVSSAEVAGVALQDADTGNRVLSAPVGSTIQVSNVLTATALLILSPTAGQVQLETDLLAGDFLSLVGIAISTSQITLEFINTGVAKA